MSPEILHRTRRPGTLLDCRDLVRSSHPWVSATGAMFTARPEADPEGNPSMPENRPPAAQPGPASYRTPVGKTLPTAHLLSATSGSRLRMIDSDGQGDAPLTSDDRHGDESAAAPTYGIERA